MDTRRLLVLGRMSLMDADGTTSLLPAGKPLALLAYLACSPAREASREQLIDLLWADTEREAARHTLRQTLWYIRRRLRMDPFQSVGDSIELVMPVVTDRDEFLQALDDGNHAEALGAYGGDFLPGFAAPGGAEFEHWTDLERSRLRALFVRSAETLVREHIAGWRAREAVQISRRARELVPDAQATWRLLLESLDAAQDRVSALAEMEQLEAWLTREEQSPDAATTALLRQLRTEPKASAEATSSDEHRASEVATELVGREREFSVLLSAWTRARRGQAGHVHIIARAGLGKTRLLDGLAKRLRSTKARVVSVRAPQVNRELPFALAADLTLALARLRGAAGVSPDSASALVALAPGVSTYLSAQPDRTTGDDALRRRTLALNELVVTIAEDAPIAILVDDLHWADATSRAMLSSLSATLHGASVLLVTASRQLDARALANETVQQLALEPLSEDEVGTLVSSMGELPLGAQPAATWAETLCPRLHLAAGGSPLMVIETLQLAMERGALALEHRRWSCPDEAGLDQTLSGGSAIRERLLAVSDANLSTLLLLAVLGTELDAPSVERAVGADGVAALHDLESRGLLTHVDGGWLMAHDEIAELARELASEPRLSRAHRQAATVLESSSPESANALLRAARHRRAAGDTRAVEQLFARIARVTESTGDERALSALAGDVLGPESTRSERDTLMHSLPWRMRRNITRSLATIVGSVAMVVTTTMLLQGLRSSPPEPAGIAWMPYVTGNDTLLLRIPVQESAWRGDREINASLITVAPRARARLLEMNSVFVKWGDTVVGSVLDATGPSAIDLVQLDLRTGNVVRLTNARGDDYGFSRSPDGRFAVFSSSRRDTVFEHTDLHLLDRTTGAQTPLTETQHWDLFPVWSHDGSRIAFIRRYAEKAPSALCVITFDASATECHVPSADIDLQTISGWDDDGHVIATGEAREEAITQIVRIAVATGQTSMLDTPTALSIMSQDGRFVIRPERGQRGEPIRVAALSRPTISASVRPPDPSGVQLASLTMWEELSGAALCLDRLTIVDADREIALDSRARLRVVGQSANGQVRNVPYVQWSVLDTTIATISARGELRPRSPGTVRVIASAGGWRADTVSINVSGQREWTTVMRERWDAIDTTRWLAYGTPTPVLARVAGSGAINPNGDGHSGSGLYQRTSVVARTGLGVEVRVRAPVVGPQWQSITLSLEHLTDDVTLSAWTDRAGPTFPDDWRDVWAAHSCLLGFPRAEGGYAMEQIAFTVGGVAERTKRTATPITDGGWHVVRLQVFADGRCGLALDGRVIAVSDGTLPLDRPLRLHLSGQSVGARMLIGQVEMWQGERHDLAWFDSDSTMSSVR